MELINKHKEDEKLIILFCKNCKKEVMPDIYLVLFPNPLYIEDSYGHEIKTSFHLKAVCSVCTKYIKHLEHSKNIFNVLNQCEILWKR